jgi:hypothetical protein
MSIARLSKRLDKIEGDIRRRYPTTYDRPTKDAWIACLRALEHRRLDEDDFEAVYEQLGPTLRQLLVHYARVRRVVRLASNEEDVPMRVPFPHFTAQMAGVEILSYRPNETASRAHLHSLNFWATTPIAALSSHNAQAYADMEEWFAERLVLRVLGPYEGIELRSQIWNDHGLITTPIHPLSRD